MAYQLKKLNPRHLAIMDKVLEGKKQKDIASEMGMSPYGISTIVRSPIFQNELSRRREGIGRRVDDEVVERRTRMLKNTPLGRHRKHIDFPSEPIPKPSVLDVLGRSSEPLIQDVKPKITFTKKQMDEMQRLKRLCFGEESVPDKGQ